MMHPVMEGHERHNNRDDEKDGDLRYGFGDTGHRIPGESCDSPGRHHQSYQTQTNREPAGINGGCDDDADDEQDRKADVHQVVDHAVSPHAVGRATSARRTSSCCLVLSVHRSIGKAASNGSASHRGGRSPPMSTAAVTEPAATKSGRPVA